MAGLDIFNSDAFGLSSMTAAINSRPFTPSFLRDLNLFDPIGIRHLSATIEKRGESLGLVQTSPRGAPPAQRTDDKRDLRDLRVVRLAKEAVVFADEVQGVRAFGTETEEEMLEAVVNRKVDSTRTEIDMTEENLMLGAIKGKILDADGSTIYNLFTEFGVSQVAEFDFELDDTATAVRQKCQEIRRLIGNNLKVGSMPFEVHALCGDAFFDALIGHAQVERAYDRWMDGQQLRENYAWESFGFANTMFWNYRSDDDGTTGVATDKAHFFARGIPNLFQMVYSPADTWETVNTIGLPRYTIPGIDPSGKDRFRSWEVQSNLLPYCTRPKHLIQAKRS